MAKIIRYFHIRPGMFSHGGATVKVTGDTTTVGQVDVQVAHCSRKDNYVKKVGRDVVERQPTKIVPLRYLPQELSRISDSVAKNTGDWTDFSYAIKYFLPKE